MKIGIIGWNKYKNSIVAKKVGSALHIPVIDTFKDNPFQSVSCESYIFAWYLCALDKSVNVVSGVVNDVLLTSTKDIETLFRCDKIHNEEMKTFNLNFQMKNLEPGYDLIIHVDASMDDILRINARGGIYNNIPFRFFNDLKIEYEEMKMTTIIKPIYSLDNLNDLDKIINSIREKQEENNITVVNENREQPFELNETSQKSCDLLFSVIQNSEDTNQIVDKIERHQDLIECEIKKEDLPKLKINKKKKTLVKKIEENSKIIEHHSEDNQSIKVEEVKNETEDAHELVIKQFQSKEIETVISVFNAAHNLEVKLVEFKEMESTIHSFRNGIDFNASMWIAKNDDSDFFTSMNYDGDETLVCDEFNSLSMALNYFLEDV